MLRLAEGLVTVTAQQRALLHDVVGGARALSEASAWMGRLSAEEEEEEEEGSALLVLPAQVRLFMHALYRQTAKNVSTD